MYKVLKDFKGSPDGYTVIEYKAGPDPVSIPPSLVEVALGEQWIEACPVVPTQATTLADPDPLIALVKRPVADIVAAFPGMSDADLSRLPVLDAVDGKVRKTLTEAVENELREREHHKGLIGSSVQPAILIAPDGTEAQLGDLVGAAHAASGLTVEDWNALADEDRERFIADQAKAWKLEHGTATE